MNISNASAIASNFFAKATRADSPLGVRSHRKSDDVGSKSPGLSLNGRPKPPQVADDSSASHNRPKPPLLSALSEAGLRGTNSSGRPKPPQISAYLASMGTNTDIPTGGATELDFAA